MEINNIYNMDCLEGLKQIEDNSIDCIITDPPYNINLVPQRKITKSIENDNMDNLQFKIFLNKIFSEINRVLKDDSYLIIFTGWSTIPLFREVLDLYFNLKSMPVWIKNNFGIGYYTRPQYEPCFLYFKGEPKPLEKPISDVWKFRKVLAPRHSCEKPIELMRFIIKSFTKENQIVLDPFLGSGTTLVACKQLNRGYVGFELEEEYYNMTKKRLVQEQIFTPEQHTLIPNKGHK